MGSIGKTGVLLVNVGTPDSSKPRDLYRYLTEFLTDGRVIDLPWLRRQLLVRGMIVPFRYRQSAKCYEKIFSGQGSPLLVHGRALQRSLQEKLGSDYCVELAMRYQKPSIEKGVKVLREQGISHLIVLPLFPQYASATVGTINQKVMEEIKQWDVIPGLSFVNPNPVHPKMIECFAKKIEKCDLSQYDHLLISFHGLPERQVRNVDQRGCCFQKGCCESLTEKNQFCYAAQCQATAREIVKKLGIDQENYSVAFQSRLGKEPWLSPYTVDQLEELAKQGKKRVLVACPSFVSDCLETLYEIAEEYQELFVEQGGEKLDLVESLNDDPLWVEALADQVVQYQPSVSV